MPMNMPEELPVYLFTGFLDSGKTTFIQDALESRDFGEGEQTLLIVCEEGEIEYEPDRFYTEGGAKYFYHETRAGERFPLTEEDITESGTRELSDAEWNEFYTLLCGGTVSNRSEDTSSGDSGPWLYLYWKNDKGTMQEYRFADYGAQQAFEQFCLRLKG